MTKESKPSGGNVFADLGFKDADEILAKAGLAVRITAAMKARKLTQLAAAGVLGIDRPKVSKPVRGDLYGFSSDHVPLSQRLGAGRRDRCQKHPAPTRQRQADREGHGQPVTAEGPPRVMNRAATR